MRHKNYKFNLISRNRMSLSQKYRWANPTKKMLLGRKITALKLKGTNRPVEVKKKIALTLTGSKYSYERIYNIMANRNLPMNQEERKLKSFLNNNWKWNGGINKLILGRKFQDFINIREKIIIEYFGSHWHKQREEEEYKKYYLKFGYKCIVIWDSDLRQGKNHIIELTLTKGDSNG